MGILFPLCNDEFHRLVLSHILLLIIEPKYGKGS